MSRVFESLMESLNEALEAVRAEKKKDSCECEDCEQELKQESDKRTD